MSNKIIDYIIVQFLEIKCARTVWSRMTFLLKLFDQKEYIAHMHNARSYDSTGVLGLLFSYRSQEIITVSRTHDLMSADTLTQIMLRENAIKK